MGRSCAWVGAGKGSWLFRSLNRKFVADLHHTRTSPLSVRASVVIFRQSVANGKTSLFKVWEDRQDFPLGIGLSEWEDEIREMIRQSFYLENLEKIGLFLGLDQRRQAGGKAEV